MSCAGPRTAEGGGDAGDLSREQRDVMLYLRGRPGGATDAELYEFLTWVEHAEARHLALGLFRAGLVTLRLRPDGEVEAEPAADAPPPAPRPLDADDGRAG